MNHDCTWSQPCSVSDLFTFWLIPFTNYSCDGWQIPACMSHSTIFMGQLVRGCKDFGAVFFLTQLVTIVTHRVMLS